MRMLKIAICEDSEIFVAVSYTHLGRPKTTYSENQKFDPSGASFFATIGGRYVYIYSGFSYDKTGPLKPADKLCIRDRSLTV